jgi:hypothetical protein
LPAIGEAKAGVLKLAFDRPRKEGQLQVRIAETGQGIHEESEVPRDAAVEQ